MTTRKIHRNMFGIYEVNWRWTRIARQIAFLTLTIAIVCSILIWFAPTIKDALSKDLVNRKVRPQAKTNWDQAIYDKLDAEREETLALLAKYDKTDQEERERYAYVLPITRTDGQLISVEDLIVMFSDWSAIEKETYKKNTSSRMSNAQKHEYQWGINSVLLQNRINYLQVWLIAHGVDLWQQDSTNNDKTRLIPSRHFEDLTKGLDVKHWGEFSHAQTLGEAQSIRSKLIRKTACERILQFASVPTVFTDMIGILMISIMTCFSVLLAEKAARIAYSLFMTRFDSHRL